MRQKMQQFMSGRYGFDDLSKIYLVVTMILLVLSMVTRFSLFYVVALALLIYTYYRALSRNITKRSAENQKYLNLRYSRVVKWNAFKKRFGQRRDYRFYKCPNCRQTVRVPRGRGKICITCPKCRAEFVKKS